MRYILVGLFLFLISNSYALNSDIVGVDGESIFAKTFVHDFENADKKTEQLKSAQPLLEMLERYKRLEEQAELYLTIGLVYSQRTGLVNPDKAIEYFSKALKYKFSDWVYAEIMMWRGNSFEQSEKYEEALKDYLQGLIICSYYDLSEGWPEIKDPPEPLYMSSEDPENLNRIMNYNRYREKLQLTRNFLRQQYYFVDAVKRLENGKHVDSKKVVNVLNSLYPDSKKKGRIVNLLKRQNERPWP